MVGKIAPDETRITYVSSYTPGRLDRLFVNYTGVQVRKGDHLAEIYSPELLVAQTEYLSALRVADIPDIGENQQVVFTDWPGRSPQDVEDQITYPLTTTLQGTPGFKTIRSYSMFGFSVVYVIFDEHRDFYWCRSRLLEKLNIAQQQLPAGVTPALGPDATGLGQVYWYPVQDRAQARSPDRQAGSSGSAYRGRTDHRTALAVRPADVLLSDEGTALAHRRAKGAFRRSAGDLIDAPPACVIDISGRPVGDHTVTSSRAASSITVEASPISWCCWAA